LLTSACIPIHLICTYSTIFARFWCTFIYVWNETFFCSKYDML
jgi:hypothetical protein